MALTATEPELTVQWQQLANVKVQMVTNHQFHLHSLHR